MGSPQYDLHLRWPHTQTDAHSVGATFHMLRGACMQDKSHSGPSSWTHRFFFLCLWDGLWVKRITATRPRCGTASRTTGRAQRGRAPLHEAARVGAKGMADSGPSDLDIFSLSPGRTWGAVTPRSWAPWWAPIRAERPRACGPIDGAWGGGPLACKALHGNRPRHARPMHFVFPPKIDHGELWVERIAAT